MIAKLRKYIVFYYSNVIKEGLYTQNHSKWGRITKIIRKIHEFAFYQ